MDSMSLKEAYEYQNYLKMLLDKGTTYLQTRDFITTTKEEHFRNKVNSNAQDETIVIPREYDFKADDVIDLMVKLIEEREKLSCAISLAKKNTDIDIDSSISMNKIKQSFARNLSYISSFKSTERSDLGIDYVFDVNNEQKPYKYPITKITTIDFNRNSVKNLIKKYTKETNDVSKKIDIIELTATVDYEPVFEYDTEFEDIVDGFKCRKASEDDEVGIVQCC